MGGQLATLTESKYVFSTIAYVDVCIIISQVNTQSRYRSQSSGFFTISLCQTYTYYLIRRRRNDIAWGRVTVNRNGLLTNVNTVIHTSTCKYGCTAIVWATNRTVASLTVPGGQEFTFLNLSSNFDKFLLSFLIFFSCSSSFWLSGWAGCPPGKALATLLATKHRCKYQ